MSSKISAARILWRIILVLVAIVAHICVIPPFTGIMVPVAAVSLFFNPLLIFLWVPLFAIPYLAGWMVLLWLW